MFATVLHWKKGQTEPPIEFMPAIIRFLGYDPFPETKNVAARMLAKRRAMGWSTKKAAWQLGVDSGTWRNWEQSGVILYFNHRLLVARLLDLPEGEVDQDMGVRWNRLHK